MSTNTVTDDMRNQAQEMGGMVVRELPAEMAFATQLSDPCIVFFEVTRRVDDERDASLHVTIRDVNDSNLIQRLDWFSRELTGKPIGNDWQFANERRPKYQSFGKGGGAKPQRVAMPDDGTGHCKIEVVAVTRKLTKGGNNPGSSFVTVHGTEYGWDANAWGNKVDGAPGFSADWRDHLQVDQRQERKGKQKLYANCSKTSRDGRDYWNVDSFELGSASQVHIPVEEEKETHF